MTLRRLPDHEGEWLYELSPCRHPEHTPPSHVVLQPGRYEHRCPSCHRSTVFTVPQGPIIKSAHPAGLISADPPGAAARCLLTEMSITSFAKAERRGEQPVAGQRKPQPLGAPQ